MKYEHGWWVPEDVGYADRRHPALSQKNDVGVIDLAMKYVRKREVVVQAGARVGLFPMALSWRFKRVMAFEPEAENFACAKLNCAVCRIDFVQAALGKECGKRRLVRSPQSGGEHYLAPASEDGDLVPVVTIDSLKLAELDALFLDVEGYELEVLRGARETIGAHTPVIVAEENALCTRYGRARGEVAKWLAGYGYRLMAEFSTLSDQQRRDKHFRGSDLVFAP